MTGFFSALRRRVELRTSTFHSHTRIPLFPADTGGSWGSHISVPCILCLEFPPVSISLPHCTYLSPLLLESPPPDFVFPSVTGRGRGSPSTPGTFNTGQAPTTISLSLPPSSSLRFPSLQWHNLAKPPFRNSRLDTRCDFRLVPYFTGPETGSELAFLCAIEWILGMMVSVRGWGGVGGAVECVVDLS